MTEAFKKREGAMPFNSTASLGTRREYLKKGKGSTYSLTGSTASIVLRKPDPMYSSTYSLNWSGSQAHIRKLGTGAGSLVDLDQDAIESPIGQVTLPLAITAAVAIFGSSFPHGWNTGVLNSPMLLIQDFLNSSYSARYGSPPSMSTINLLWSLTVSIYLVGGCGGAFSAGWLADRFGRKKALLVCHVFGFVAALLFGFCKTANSLEMMIAARLVVGFGCGAGSGLVPMYLTEIAPVNIRGAMGVLHQFALTCGILVSQAVGLREVLGNDQLWHVLLALTALPCVLSLFILPFFPDSPRYLLVNLGKRDEAVLALQKFRGTDDVELDIREMQQEYEQQKLEPKWTFRQLLSNRSLRMPLLLVCALACAQQLSGINVVFYYSTVIFEGAGIPTNKTQYAVLGTGIINVLMTGISVPLMEKSGRRPLLLGGMVGMIIAAVTITIALNLQGEVHWMAYVSIFCMIAFVVGFAIGLGSIPQFIGAELFQTGPRPPAMSIAGFLNWLCNFLVAMVFPSMQTVLKAFSFIPFIILLVLFLIFIWIKLPETKNRSFQEIYDMFKVGDEEKGKQVEDDNRLTTLEFTPDPTESEVLVHKVPNGKSVAQSPSANTEMSTVTNGTVSPSEEEAKLLQKETVA